MSKIKWWWGLPGLQKPRLSPKSWVKEYSDLIAFAQRAEELNYDAIGVTEHHFWYDGYCPSLLPVLAGLAKETNRIGLLTSALLLTVHDPLRVAEEAAFIDVLSNGRLILGCGVAYRPEEFSGLQVPMKARGMRCREAMRFLKQALSAEDSFSFHGKFYDYDDVRLVPKAIQKPHPPIWFAAGGGDVTSYWGGRNGFDYYAGPATDLPRVKELTEKYFEGVRDGGRDTKDMKMCLVRDVAIAETMEEARAIVTNELMPMYIEQLIGFGFLLDDKGQPLRDLPETHPVYHSLVDSIIWGTPEKVARDLERFVDIGFTAFMPRIFGVVWDMPKQVKMMELFAGRVMPYFA